MFITPTRKLSCNVGHLLVLCDEDNLVAHRDGDEDHVTSLQVDHFTLGDKIDQIVRHELFVD